jgi:hypothetical protein
LKHRYSFLVLGLAILNYCHLNVTSALGSSCWISRMLLTTTEYNSDSISVIMACPQLFAWQPLYCVMLGNGALCNQFCGGELSICLRTKQFSWLLESKWTKV